MKKKNQSIFFNEEKILNDLYTRAQRDGLSLQPRKRDSFMKKNGFKWAGSIILATSLIFAVVVLNQPKEDVSIIDQIAEKTVIAYVSVDINPSFEISVYDDNTVESIAQLNEDALTIDVSDLIGMDVDLAIETIVARATEAGFIDTTDVLDDYVLVTTVMSDEATTPQEEALYLKIQDRLHVSETLNSVYVVELKSDMATKFEADEKNVPVGLYVINGQVLQDDGSYLSVKDIFSNEEKVSELTHTYQLNISDISVDQLTLNIQALLDKLVEQGIDVSAYEALMVDADIDALHALHDQILADYPELMTGLKINQNTDVPMGDPENTNQPEETGVPKNESETAPVDGTGPKDGAGSENQGGKNN